MSAVITELLRSPAERRRANDFADLLDGRRNLSGHELESLVTLANTLRCPERAPSSDFSADLRARLVAQTSMRSASPQVPIQRTPHEAAPHRRRVRQAVAAAAAVAVLGGAGAAVASTRALPGDPLYGVKRGIESVQLSLAGSELSRGRELLEQAGARLSEAERLAGADGAVAADTRARIEQALADMEVSLQQGAETLTGVYEETGDVAALELLDRFVVDQERRLTVLLDRLGQIDAGLREIAAAAAGMLRSLHAEVVALTRSTSAATGSELVPGAARDQQPAGDGGPDGPVPADLEPSGPQVPAADGGGAEQAPLATDGSGGDVLGDLTSGDVGAGTDGIQTPPDVLPDVPLTRNPAGGSTSSIAPALPGVPGVATSPVTFPPVNPGAALPCTPVAPLTSC